MTKSGMSDEVQQKFAGRMYELVDIRRGIESGDLKTVADVLSFVIESAEKIESGLRGEGVLDGFRILLKEEFDARAREVEQHLTLAALDASAATRR